ncbi:hypothetical protein ACFVAJ_17845 [Agromyces sp. NPDC057679]|uniref:hypothetical protein n=1 Tax=Agromyces sp. NPDC057679 TaxID=3346207 RepID=UPI00366CAA41
MMFDQIATYPKAWQPVLAALLEVLNEYAPGTVTLKSVDHVGDEVKITIAVPWHSDTISSAHRVAERTLTKMVAAPAPVDLPPADGGELSATGEAWRLWKSSVEIIRNGEHVPFDANLRDYPLAISAFYAGWHRATRQNMTVGGAVPEAPTVDVDHLEQVRAEADAAGFARGMAFIGDLLGDMPIRSASSSHEPELTIDMINLTKVREVAEGSSDPSQWADDAVHCRQTFDHAPHWWSEYVDGRNPVRIPHYCLG